MPLPDHQELIDALKPFASVGTLKCAKGWDAELIVYVRLPTKKKATPVAYLYLGDFIRAAELVQAEEGDE